MQRELETVEAQYALDRRRKSSDDVISTPSSYRSRSSSIPSSEEVDEPKLYQVSRADRSGQVRFQVSRADIRCLGEEELIYHSTHPVKLSAGFVAQSLAFSM